MTLADLVGLHTLTGWDTFSVGNDSSASDWIINDIRIGNRSAFVERGQIVSRPRRIAFRPMTSHLLLRLDNVLHDFIKGGGVTRPDYAEADDLAKEETALDTPIVLMFYAYGAGPMLYAIDERSGEVVLEAGSIVRMEEVTHSEWPDDEDGEVGENGYPLTPPIERIELVARREHFLRFDPAGFVPEWWAAYEATSQRDSGDSETISASTTEP